MLEKVAYTLRPTNGFMQLQRMAQRTVADFRRNNGEEYTMFNYAPFLLAGLLRWRLKEPSALLSGTDPIATDFLAAIEQTEDDLGGRRRPSANLQKRRDKFIPILRDLKAELLGEGTNPGAPLKIALNPALGYDRGGKPAWG